MDDEVRQNIKKSIEDHHNTILSASSTVDLGLSIHAKSKKSLRLVD